MAAEEFATNAQRWAQIALKAGFTVCVSAFLIWFLTQRIDTKIDAMGVSQAKIQVQNETVIEQMWQLIAVGQATCLNVAKTSEERRACITVERRRPQ